MDTQTYICAQKICSYVYPIRGFQKKIAQTKKKNRVFKSMISIGKFDGNYHLEIQPMTKKKSEGDKCRANIPVRKPCGPTEWRRCNLCWFRSEMF